MTAQTSNPTRTSGPDSDPIHTDPTGTPDPARPDPVVPGSAAYRLSAALLPVAALAAGGTLAIPGVLRGPAAMNGCARGTALVMLAVAVPVLSWSMTAARRGSARAVLGWLGATGYLLYNAVLLLFGTPFNRLFPLYVATFALAVWSLVTTLRAVDLDAFARERAPGLPYRAVAVYAWVVAGANALIWLKGVVAGLLATGRPAFLAGTGLVTNPVYVQDLGFWLPLIAVAAWWLWRSVPWGLPVLGSLLVMLVIESVGIAADQAFGHAADPSSPAASAGAVPLFLVLAAVGLVPVVLVLRHLRRPAVPGDRPPHAP